MEISLNVYYVEQANLSIIIRNRKAIIYDCGTLDNEKWRIENLDSDNDKKMWKNFLNDNIDNTEGDLSFSIKFLCNCLKKN